MAGSTADQQAFTEFVHARSGALYRAAYLMVGDEHRAHDLLQEALTKTYQAWRRLRDPANAEAYTRKAITTTAISWFRRKGWYGEQPTDVLPEDAVSGFSGLGGGLGDALGDDLAERDALWQALQTLPPRQRVALVLRYYLDYSEAQTAEAMGCAVGTVKSQSSAGLTRLRERLHVHDRDLIDLGVTR